MHWHHGFPQALRMRFLGIDIENIDEYVFSVNGYEHLFRIHGGAAGGKYNLFWREFFEGIHGAREASDAFQWLAFFRANGFRVP
jgi:hypothetical protein